MIQQMNNWPRVSIKEVCQEIVDCVNKTAPIVDYPTPYKMIRTSNVKGGWVNLDQVNFVTEEVYKKWTRRIIPVIGDLILTREAPLGEVGMIRDNETIFLGQRLMLYRANPAKLDNRFLLYSFLSKDLQGQIKALGSGSTVEHMRVPDAEKLTILLPEIETQSKIGIILSTYDELIKNNTRRIKILEEMAQLIYREWFVNFRFPGHENVKLVESELGMIPEGWEVKPLREVAEINGQMIRKNYPFETINYIDISSVSTGRIDKVEEYNLSEAPGRARRIVKHGDIIWSTVRPNRKSYSLIINPKPNVIVSSGFAVITSMSVHYTYLYQTVTTDEFVGYLVNRATGSAYPAVLAHDFEIAPILVPPKEILDTYSKNVSSIYDLINVLQIKNQNLKGTRDLLLPQLISGRVDISDLDINIVNEN